MHISCVVRSAPYSKPCGTRYGRFQINPKGRSAAQGLSMGDAIVSICGNPTKNMTHAQVKQEILRAGNEIDLVVAKWVQQLGGTGNEIDLVVTKWVQQVLRQKLERQ